MPDNADDFEFNPTATADPVPPVTARGGRGWDVFRRSDGTVALQDPNLSVSFLDPVTARRLGEALTACADVPVPARPPKKP